MAKIDIDGLDYGVVVVGGNGKKYKLDESIQELGWDENENEIAAKISFKVRNEKTKDGYISSLCQPGDTVIVYANAGKGSREVARGMVVSIKNTRSNDHHDAEVVCYDALYDLQKSQDYFFFPSGRTARARIKGILEKWNVPIVNYDGPKCRLGKKRYEAGYLSDIILDILKKAEKKDGNKYIIRMNGKNAEVVKRGSNDKVYCFDSDCSVAREHTQSIADIVTRVKIVGNNKKAKTPKKIAVVNGKTKFGLKQRIYTRSDDESVSEAKKTAKGIIRDEGTIKAEGKIQAPDIPFLRKGDKVKCDFIPLKGYYYIIGISHDADSKSMTLTVRK